MIETWIYVIVAVLIISLISLIGVFTLSLRTNTLKKYVLLLVAFSAGAMFGGAFLHLLPELIEHGEFTILSSILILAGISLFFIVEKLIHWQHCHMPITEDHVHPFAYMNLIGDGIHNLLDGIIIAGSFLINPAVGIATTIAVAVHEIPQEIGDFGVLIHGGFSKTKALAMNFLSALTAVIGAVLTLVASEFIENLEIFLVPLAIGSFIYIAGSDLIPELHKEQKFTKSLIQITAFIIGIAIMTVLLLFEGAH